MRGIKGAASFEHGNDRKNIVKVLLGHFIDKATTTRLMTHQTLGSEHLECFAQRCARDGPQLAQGHFIDETARRELTIKDVVAQL